jgi:hypothetical protein
MHGGFTSVAVRVSRATPLPTLSRSRSPGPWTTPPAIKSAAPRLAERMSAAAMGVFLVEAAKQMDGGTAAGSMKNMTTREEHAQAVGDGGRAAGFAVVAAVSIGGPGSVDGRARSAGGCRCHGNDGGAHRRC